MTRNIRILILVCVFGLIALTGLVAFDVPVPGDAELVQLALSTRSDSLTVAIWILTFISSSIPALSVTLAVSGIEQLVSLQRKMLIGGENLVEL